MDTRRVEQRLREALAARADQVRPEDLRPAPVPPTPAARTAHRPHRFLLALAAPAALTVVLAITVGSWVLARQPSDGGPAPAYPPQAAGAPTSAEPDTAEPSIEVQGLPSESDTVAPVIVTAAPRTTTVPGTSRRATVPAFTVSGGTTDTADRIRRLLSKHVTGLVDGYRNRADLRTLQITAAAIEPWEDYLSVRLDTTDDFGGPHGTDTTTALVMDTRTGSPATAGDLFTDITAVDEIMRTALAGRPGPDRPTEIDELTMRSGTGIAPVWYPADDGLHWVLDECAHTPCVTGPAEAIVAWPELAAHLRP